MGFPAGGDTSPGSNCAPGFYHIHASCCGEPLLCATERRRRGRGCRVTIYGLALTIRRSSQTLSPLFLDDQARSYPPGSNGVPTSVATATNGAPSAMARPHTRVGGSPRCACHLLIMRGCVGLLCYTEKAT